MKKVKCDLLSGNSFDIEKITADDIELTDIARGLSNLCRYSGQVSRFYSVAKHSIFLSVIPGSILKTLTVKLGTFRILRKCLLLHDASEAYLVDVPAYVKPMISGYCELEKKIQNAIWRRFGLLSYTKQPEIQNLIKTIDKMILPIEYKAYRKNIHFAGVPIDNSKEKLWLREIEKIDRYDIASGVHEKPSYTYRDFMMRAEDLEII